MILFLTIRSRTRTFEVRPNYDVGQRVLYRKGDGKPFLHEGQILKKVGRYTYSVSIDGRVVRYNKRNLKPLFGSSSSEQDDQAVRAYDDVRIPTNTTQTTEGHLLNTSPTPACDSLPHRQIEPDRKRYPTRSRRPPLFYDQRV